MLDIFPRQTFFWKNRFSIRGFCLTLLLPTEHSVFLSAFSSSEPRNKLLPAKEPQTTSLAWSRASHLWCASVADPAGHWLPLLLPMYVLCTCSPPSRWVFVAAGSQVFIVVQSHGPPEIQTGTEKQEKRAAGWWMPGSAPIPECGELVNTSWSRGFSHRLWVIGYINNDNFF